MRQTDEERFLKNLILRTLMAAHSWFEVISNIPYFNKPDAEQQQRLDECKNRLYSRYQNLNELLIATGAEGLQTRFSIFGLHHEFCFSGEMRHIDQTTSVKASLGDSDLEYEINWDNQSNPNLNNSNHSLSNSANHILNLTVLLKNSRQSYQLTIPEIGNHRPPKTFDAN